MENPSFKTFSAGLPSIGFFKSKHRDTWASEEEIWHTRLLIISCKIIAQLFQRTPSVIKWSSFCVKIMKGFHYVFLFFSIFKWRYFFQLLNWGFQFSLGDVVLNFRKSREVPGKKNSVRIALFLGYLSREVVTFMTAVNPPLKSLAHVSLGNILPSKIWSSFNVFNKSRFCQILFIISRNTSSPPPQVPSTST